MPVMSASGALSATSFVRMIFSGVADISNIALFSMATASCDRRLANSGTACRAPSCRAQTGLRWRRSLCRKRAGVKNSARPRGNCRIVEATW